MLSLGVACALLSARWSAPTSRSRSPSCRGAQSDAREGRRCAPRRRRLVRTVRGRELDALIAEALEQNIDLRTASAACSKRARLGISRAGLFPNTFGSPDSALSPTESDDTSHSLGIGLSWEIDVFGKLRRTREAAEAELLASEDGARAVTVTLVSSVSGTYYNIRELDRLISIVEQTIASQEASLELVRDQLASGIVSAAEESQALALLASTRASLPALRAQRVAAQNALSVLRGRIPDRGLVARRDDPQAPGLPAFTVGLPTELLAERPDVRAAGSACMRRRRAGVAIANRFPSRPSVSRASPAISARISTTCSTVRTCSPGADRCRADHRLRSHAPRRRGRGRAIDSGCGGVSARGPECLREVSDALAALDAAEEIIGHNRVREGATREALRLQRSRFKQGVVAYIEVLDAERQHLAAQQALATAEYGSVQSFLVLYRALGGGADETRLQETLAALDAEE